MTHPIPTLNTFLKVHFTILQNPAALRILRQGGIRSTCAQCQNRRFPTLSMDKTMVAYRFLWLRTFEQPVAIRLTIRPDRTGLLIGKVTNGHGGYEPGKLSKNNSIEVSNLQVQQFLSLLQKTSFWTSQTEQMT